MAKGQGKIVMAKGQGKIVMAKGQGKIVMAKGQDKILLFAMILERDDYAKHNNIWKMYVLFSNDP